jgi:hypothetical protein
MMELSAKQSEAFKAMPRLLCDALNPDPSGHLHEVRLRDGRTFAFVRWEFASAGGCDWISLLSAELCPDPPTTDPVPILDVDVRISEISTACLSSLGVD